MQRSNPSRFAAALLTAGVLSACGLKKQELPANHVATQPRAVSPEREIPPPPPAPEPYVSDRSDALAQLGDEFDAYAEESTPEPGDYMPESSPELDDDGFEVPEVDDEDQELEPQDEAGEDDEE